jgi:hypothetical protein
MEEISAVLKYYLHFRNTFSHNSRGHLPPQSYKHIEEVLESALADGVLRQQVDVEADAKVITHAINGYILEYYPTTLSTGQKKKLADQLTKFIARAYRTQHRDDHTVSSFLF